MKSGFVYILASERNGTLYIGVTSNLIKRVYQHKQNILEGFTKKYGVHTLVHHEHSEDIYSAIEREKQLKKWDRKWKIELIEKENPMWRDLYYDLVKDPTSSFPRKRESRESSKTLDPRSSRG